jgi:hypothetical protein
MTEIARILGYPNFTPQSSLDLSYPYFSSPMAQYQPYAMLQARLAAAANAEQVLMLGAESDLFGSFFTPATAAAVFSTSSTIAPNVTVRLNLGGNQYTYVTQAGDTPDIVAAIFAELLAADPTGSALFMPNPIANTLNLVNVAAVGTDANGVQCLAASSDPSLLISFGGTPSQFAAGSTAGGSVPPGPQFTDIKSGEVTFGYVPIIHILESDLINARQNLDTLKAEEWEPRQDELDVRKALYDDYRRQLANCISVPLDPDIPGNDNRIAQRVR